MDAKALERTLKKHVAPHAKGFVVRGTHLLDCSVLPWLLRGYEFETSPDPQFTRLYVFVTPICFPKPGALRSPTRHARYVTEELAWKGSGYFIPDAGPAAEQEIFADAIEAIARNRGLEAIRIATVQDYITAYAATDPDMHRVWTLAKVACLYAAIDEYDAALDCIAAIQRIHGTGKGRDKDEKEEFAEISTLANGLERRDGSHRAIQRVWATDWADLYKVREELANVA